MVDAFAHLDVAASDPLEDLRKRLDSAGIERALVVESWSGDNRRFLDRLFDQPDPRFRLAFCFPAEAESPMIGWLRDPSVFALRLRTADLERTKPWVGGLESAGKVLLVHAESGIDALAFPLRTLAETHPDLRIYLPHLGWPRKDGRDDPAWDKALESLRRLPNLIGGVSALAYFSIAPYPHEDLRPQAQRFMWEFSPSSVVLGTDYPLFEKSRYADYAALGRAWIESGYPHWSENNALFT